MMKKFIRQKNRNSKTMGVVLLIAVLCLSVVYAALYSVIYMYGTGSVDISCKNFYYWVDDSTNQGMFYSSCDANGNLNLNSATGITKMSVAVNTISEGGSIYMLSPYEVSEDETVTVDTKSVIIQRYVLKDAQGNIVKNGDGNIQLCFNTGPLFNVSHNLKFNFVYNKDDSKDVKLPCLVIDGNEVESDDSAFRVSKGATLTLGNDLSENVERVFSIENNYSYSSGGAIHSLGGSVVGNIVQFTNNCAISESETYGGAVYAGSSYSEGTNAGSTLELNNCSFKENTARNSKKGHRHDGSVYIKGNASAYGGAIYIQGSKVSMSGCTFTGNAADVENNNETEAAGGAVYIDSTSSGSMNNCTVTGNQLSCNSRAGAGVYVAAGNNAFALGGVMTIKDNSCYYLNEETQSGLNGNDNLHLFGNNGNISIDTSKVSAGSEIFLNVNPAPSENEKLKALISDDSHKITLTNITECFKSDLGGYKASVIEGDGLYLIFEPTYDELWYGGKIIKEHNGEGEIVDSESPYKSFFSDKDLTNDTGFTRLADAVGAIKTGKTIHMLTSYEVSASEVVNLPESKVVNVVRESTFTDDSMFKIIKAKFTLNALDANSLISFDGNSVSSSIQKGGAFYVEGDVSSFELNGAEGTQNGESTKTIVIKNNVNSSSTVYGSGVYVNGGSSTLTNCSITGNTATSSSSSAEGFGAGIYFRTGGNKLKNCSITNNTISTPYYAQGGGVYIYTGTNTLENCSITGNTVSATNSYGGGVYLKMGSNTLFGGKMNITGNSFNSSDDNLYLGRSTTVDLNNALETGSQIGVAAAESVPVKFATNATEAMKEYFTSDDSRYTVKFVSSEKALYLALPTYDDLWYQTDTTDNTKKFFSGSSKDALTATDITEFNKAVSKMSETGTIHMLTSYEKSATETTTVPAGKNITVVRDEDFTDASMFKITGGTFEIDATDASSSITFDGKKIETTVLKGGAFYVIGGSIKLSGTEKTEGDQKEKTIVIKDNAVSSPYSRVYGGGVYINSGINTLENCSITDNTVSYSPYAYGGGVYINSGTNTLENCSIAGNTVSSSSVYAYGGGVYINSGTNTLENCSITSNTASSSAAAYGGGVYINSGTNTLLSTMNITGNTAKKSSDSSDSNMYFISGETVALSDGNGKTLSTDSQISVRVHDNPSAGRPVQFATGATEDMKKCFTSDDSSYAVRFGSNEKALYLSASTYTDLWYKADDNGTKRFFEGTDKNSLISTEITDFSEAVQRINSSKTIHMLTSYERSESETTTVPANKKITVVRDGDFTTDSMFKITGGTFEINAPNTSSSITFDGQNITPTAEYKGGVFNVYEGGAAFKLSGAEKSDRTKTIVIQNSVVSGTDCWGGGIYCRKTTNEISNCNIINNSAEYGGAVYFDYGTNTVSNCTITDNKCENLGAVSFWEGTNLLADTVKITDNKTTQDLSSNIFLNSSTVNLYDSSSNKKLSTSSQIGVTTKNAPTSGNPVQFATNASEEMAACFTSDDEKYKVTLNDTILQLEVNTYSDLWYKTDTTDNTKKFFAGASKDALTATDITEFNVAVSKMSETGTIHMLASYEKSESETTEVPAGKNITVVRDEGFTTDSMFKITGGTFEINAPDASSSITFDGKGIEITEIINGGAFNITGDTTQFALNGAEGTKNITVTNNTLPKYEDDDSKFEGDSNSMLDLLKFFGANGGGISGFDKGKIKLTNCTISKNTAASCGGGVASFNELTMDNCDVVENSALGNSYYSLGGAVAGVSGPNKSISNCLIARNKCGMFAGGMLFQECSVVISHCDIMDNTSVDSTGGIALIGGTTSKVSDCNISGNTCASLGGGVYVDGEGVSCIFENCSVTNNKVKRNSYGGNNGGGMYIGCKTVSFFGTMKVTDNTTIDTDSVESSSNIYFSKTIVGLSDDSGNKLSADSKIGIERPGNLPYKFAEKGDETMEGCFESDDANCKVMRIDSDFYLQPLYDNLYYSTKSGSGKFYSDFGCNTDALMTKLSQAVEYMKSGGKIYLESQYVPSDGETVNVPAGKEITVARYNTFKDASMFKITGGTFTVNAKDASSSIAFDGQGIETTVEKGGAFCVDGGSLELNGADKSGGGKTISIQNNIISLSSTSTSAYTYGGGVYILDGTNTLENCSITNNMISASSTSVSATARGGGVYIWSGTNTLTNCSITSNTISTSANSTSRSATAQGGGIYLNYNGTNTLTNCSISSNTASAYNTNTTSSIRAVSQGGGVYVNNGGTHTLENCSVTGNTVSVSSSSGTTVQGGGVYISIDTTLLGTMNITGNTAKVGSTSSSNNLHLASSYKVALSDSNGNKLSTSSKIGVTTGNVPTASTNIQFATGATEAMKACFTPDEAEREVIYENGGLYLKLYYDVIYQSKNVFYTDAACSSANKISDITTLSTAVNYAKKISFVGVYEAKTAETVTIPAGKTVTFLRGKDFGSDYDNASMIYVNGATFKITMGSADSNLIADGGKIEASYAKGPMINIATSSSSILYLTGSSGTKNIEVKDFCTKFTNGGAGGDGGAICNVNSGSIRIENCKFTGNYTKPSRGGAIYNGGGDSYIRNCEFSDNHADSKKGGAVHGNAGTLEISNCTVNGCSATYGGAFSFDGKGTTKIYNCTITGCSATYGGALYFTDSGTNKIYDCTITGNTSTNNGPAIDDEGGTNYYKNCTITNNVGTFGSKTKRGALNVATASGTGQVHFDGYMIIKDNTIDGEDYNLYIVTDRTIVLDSGFDPVTSTPIGIRMGANKGNFAKMDSGSVTSAIASCFKSDNTSYKVTYTSSYVQLASS